MERKSTKSRTLLLVIDGLGVGELDDVKDSRPQDIGSHTLNSIRSVSNSHWQNLEKLNLFSLDNPRYCSLNEFNITVGKSYLGYPGADSYLGHRTLIGNKINIEPTFVEDIFPIVKEQIFPSYNVTFEDNIICIDHTTFISNNVETDLGLNLNVLGILAQLPQEEILKIGQQLREVVDCARVIVLGGHPLDIKTVKACLETKESKGSYGIRKGICIPKTGIYNDDLYAVHLGPKITNKNNLVDIFLENGLPVSLIGKTADLFHRDAANSLPGVHTPMLLNSIEKQLVEQEEGLIFANIQEVDLAGHEQDPFRGKRTLDLIDAFLPKIWLRLRPNDLFIITADHGNDPLIGHAYHTREFVPVISLVKQFPSQKLIAPTTIADIGCTVCEYHGLPKPEMGRNFLQADVMKSKIKRHSIIC